MKKNRILYVFYIFFYMLVYYTFFNEKDVTCMLNVYNCMYFHIPLDNGPSVSEIMI